MGAVSARPGQFVAQAHSDPHLQELLHAAALEHAVPGALIAFSRNGERRIAVSGVANSRTALEMTADTLIPTLSFTKVWTAVLVMQLVEKGVVALDDPVRRHLPDFALADRQAAEQVTIRQLLTHTGGFAGESVKDFGPGDDALARYVASLSNAVQLHAPGEMFSYCSAGFNVLGQVVAAVCGTTWEEQVRDKILRPLRLHGVAITSDEAMYYRNSVGHVVSEGEAQVVVPFMETLRSCAPTGSRLRTSVTAALTFCEDQLGVTSDGGGRLLTAESMAEMQTAKVSVPGSSIADHWGLGWSMWDWGKAQAFGHGGDYWGHTIFVRIVPDQKLSVVLAVNGGDGRAMYEAMVPVLVEDLCGLRVPRAPQSPENPATIDTARYSGTYQGPLGTYAVTPACDGRGLMITEAGPRGGGTHLGGRRAERYVRLREETFVADQRGLGPYRTLSFVGASDGQARYLHNSRVHARVGDGTIGATSPSERRAGGTNDLVGLSSGATRGTSPTCS